MASSQYKIVNRIVVNAELPDGFKATCFDRSDREVVEIAMQHGNAVMKEPYPFVTYEFVDSAYPNLVEDTVHEILKRAMF